MLYLALAFGEGDDSIHLLVVALHERDVVLKAEKIRRFQFARGGLLLGVLCLVKPIQEEVNLSETAIPYENVRIGCDGLLGGFECHLPSPGSFRSEARQQFSRVRWFAMTRKGLSP